jgi:hypothetical protein
MTNQHANQLMASGTYRRSRETIRAELAGRSDRLIVQIVRPVQAAPIMTGSARRGRLAAKISVQVSERQIQ